MPITFPITPTDAWVGPGFEVQVVTDFIGPIEFDSHWLLELNPVGIEGQPIYIGRQDGVGSHEGFVIMGTTNGQANIGNNIRTNVHEGQAMTLTAELVDPRGVTIDSGSVQVRLDATTALPQWMGRLPGQTGGGLTAEQALQLEQTHEATIRTMGVAPSQIDIPIDSLVVHPPFGLLRIQPLSIPVSGDGSLPPPNGDSSRWHGLWWEFLQVPPNLGYLDGIHRRYHVRMLQLRTVFDLGGVDIAGQLLDADYERVLWLFDEAFPSRVDFTVLPGVTVAMHYVQPFGLVP